MKMYRQGDVLLIPTKSIPPRAEPAPLENGRIILAHGEVTGHAHAITATATVQKLAHDGVEYLRASDTVMLTHEEHETIAVAPGTYRIQIQREYTPEAIRRVVD